MFSEQDNNSQTPIIIAINGTGVLDDDEACVILKEHRENIENSGVKVKFIIGKNVTATTPAFWQLLVFDPLMKNCYEKPCAPNVLTLQRFGVEFIDSIEDNGEQEGGISEREEQQHKIYHRFAAQVSSVQYGYRVQECKAALLLTSAP